MVPELRNACGVSRKERKALAQKCGERGQSAVGQFRDVSGSLRLGLAQHHHAAISAPSQLSRGFQVRCAACLPARSAAVLGCYRGPSLGVSSSDTGGAIDPSLPEVGAVPVLLLRFPSYFRPAYKSTRPPSCEEAPAPRIRVESYAIPLTLL